MKVGNILMLLALFFGLIGSNCVTAQTQEAEPLDEDNYGKVLIKVIDVNSLEPVKEIFRVNFFNSIKVLELREKPFDTSSLEWYGKTDNKGHLITRLTPGVYYLQFIPKKSESKYEYEPSPLLSERNRQQITVESYKITEVIKKANYGGKLNIILVDPNGKRINPQVDFFNDIKIKLIIDSEEYDFGIFPVDTMTAVKLTEGKDDLNDGEVVIGRLYPGKYKIEIDFGLLGYKHQHIMGIQISRNQTTITEVVVDINNNTGIEGIITDQNGNPLSNLYVNIDSTQTKTDQNGFYRIVGIDEGEHLMGISSKPYEYNGIFINTVFRVKININMINRKDYEIEIQ